MQSFGELLDRIGSWTYLIIIIPVLGIIVEVLKDKLKNLFSKLFETVSAYSCFCIKQLPVYKKYILDNYQTINTPFISDCDSLKFSMNKVYIHRKMHINGYKGNSCKNIYELLNDYQKIIVTGSPGSGKSLLCKSILLDYANNMLKFRKRIIPILIELHRIDNVDKINFLELISKEFGYNNLNQAKLFVENELKRGGILLLFDGLDEVNDKERRDVVNKIVVFLKHYYECKVIVTCRSLVYKNEFQAEWNSKRAEISDFDYDDINRFLNSLPYESTLQNKSPEKLFQNLKEQPKQVQELFKNPLLLTTAAYLYLFKNEFNVFPHSRSSFYKEVIDILLSEKLGRDMQFPVVKKRAVLQRIAYAMQVNNKNTIKYDEIINIILPVIHNEDQANLVLNEIKDKSGLIYIANRSRDEYQFFHITFREFFAAQKIASDGNFNELISQFFENPDSWREPIKFWCGLADDSSSVIHDILSLEPITALECLTDIQYINQDTLKEILFFFQKELCSSDQKNTKIICKILGTIASDFKSSQGKEVFDMLNSTLRAPKSHFEFKAAADALSYTYHQDSAKLLSKYTYKSPSVVAEALSRMGDVAVEGIEELAIKGNVKAMDSLRLIKNPNALKALAKSSLQLIKKVEKEDCVYHAAWHLASLLPNPDLKDIFNGYNVDDIIRKEIIPWIWKPFEKNGEFNSNMSILSGRIAYLISRKPCNKINIKKRILDPRLTIPVYLELKNQDDEQHKEIADCILSVIPQGIRENVEGKLIDFVSEHWSMIYISEIRLIRNFTITFTFKVVLFITAITYLSCKFLDISSIYFILAIISFEMISLYRFFKRESSLLVKVFILSILFVLMTEIINFKEISSIDIATKFIFVGKKIAAIFVWLGTTCLCNYIFSSRLNISIKTSQLYGILGKNKKETQEKFLTFVGQSISKE